MSMLLTLVRRIARVFADAPASGPELDAMSLRQWADLPPYHPINDRSGDGAPC